MMPGACRPGLAPSRNDDFAAGDDLRRVLRVLRGDVGRAGERLVSWVWVDCA